jgi:hypothetical protein
MKPHFTLLFLFLALSSVFVITACDDDDAGSALTGEVNVNFLAEFDGNDLAVQSGTYDYPDGSQLKIQLFQYYVSDLALIPADGGEAVPLADILLVRYNSALDDNLDSYSFADVPAGEYTGLRYGLGVSPDLNNMDPSEFAADFVLNEVEFWNANVRYVFAKVEANVDLNANGTFDTPVSYHLGRNDIYTTITFNAPITVTANDVIDLDVTADVQKALVTSDTDFRDFSIEGERIIHGGNQEIAFDIWERLREQFTLQLR